jgi:hypothetical protein
LRQFAMEAGMAKRIVLAIAFILSAANSAPAIECLGLPDMTIQGTWQWQIIDGKFCWYLGDRSIPKEQLRWPGAAQSQPRKLAGPSPGQKIQCREQIDKSKSGHWHWRTVDQRQCWFIGERETPREWLQWPPRERAELPVDVQAMLQRAEEPQLEAATDPDSMKGWQIVNQPSGGDLEFIVQDIWIAFLSIDLNVGAEFFTQVPMSLWPVLAERTPRPDRVATVAKESGPGH